ncbi:hypothetical protein ACS0TY_000197 [Phlomoides rotata]
MGFNSGSKSISSNPSSSSSCNSDGNKSATLGMAWAANSRSASLHFPNLDGRIRNYINSLTCCLKLFLHWDPILGIYSGLSIFIDGYTVPPTQELRGYMLKH